MKKISIFLFLLAFLTATFFLVNDTLTKEKSNASRLSILKNKISISSYSDETGIKDRIHRKYSAIAKGLYAWNSSTTKKIDGIPNWVHLLKNTNNSADKLIEFARLHTFTHINLFIGSMEWEWESYFQNHVLPYESDIYNVLKKAKQNNIYVYALYYLNDDPNDFTNKERVEDLVEAVHAFNVKYPDAPFAGIHGDQEPYNSGQYADYLAMNTLIKQKITALHASLTTDVSLKPSWITEMYTGSQGQKEFYKYALDSVDVGTLMDYYDDETTIINKATPILAYAATAGKKINIAFETGWVNVTDPNTFYEELTADKENFFLLINRLHNRFSEYSSYQQIVIHDNAQYFKVMYGAEPYDYTGTITKVYTTSSSFTSSGHCIDLDNDGFGNPASNLCTDSRLDCNDDTNQVNPGAVEICNGRDNNCDGKGDDGCVASTAGYVVQKGIIYHNGKAINLFGVNLPGFHGRDNVIYGLWQQNYKVMIGNIKGRGFNAIRIPFSSVPLGSGVMPTNINYYVNPELQGLDSISVMDKIIEELNRQEMYFIFDCHTDYATDSIPELWYTDQYTEEQWITDLKFLANRYRSREYFVGLDLKNEPHGQATWGTGDKTTDWKWAAERASAEVLATNSNILIFVEGIQDNAVCSTSTWGHGWGGNLEPQSCYPINIPRDKLVFAPHVYGPDVYNHTYFSDPAFPENMPEIWDTHFGYLFDQGYAVAIGEFGGKYGHAHQYDNWKTPDPHDITWQNAIVDYFIKKGLRYFFYWTWNPNSGDTGGILQDDDTWTNVWQDKYDNLKRLMDAYNKRLVGYYPNWAIYSPRNVYPKDIEIDKITHINYAFAKIDTSGNIILTDTWADTDYRDNWQIEKSYWGNFRQFYDLKQAHPHFKTLISIGGWTKSDTFPAMAASAAARANFAEQCISFCDTYDFDGIDIDWEYPCFYDMSDPNAPHTGTPADKQNYTLLLQELYPAFKKHTCAKHSQGLLLTIAAPAGPDHYPNMELNKIHPYLDWMNLMTYDLHGTWDTETNHQAALYSDPVNDPNDQRLNIDTAVGYYRDQGVPAEKINLGIPLYGRTYANAGSTSEGLYSAHSGLGTGTVDTELGIRYFYDIKNNVLSTYTRYWDDIRRAPYLHHPTTKEFISYDDETVMKEKCDYIRDNGLAGAMVWELGQDRRPQWNALTAINNGLKNFTTVYHKGIAYTSWAADEYSQTNSDLALAEIKSWGADSITVLATWYMDTVTSTAIHSVTDAPTDQAVKDAIDKAHAQGLNVMLKPHVDILSGAWRGEITFSTEADWSAWFASYKDFIVHYAKIAQEKNAEMFCIGTELEKTVTRYSDWQKIIDAVRTVYFGPLTYATNYDNIDIQLWNNLEYIGIDGYYDLTDKDNPSAAELDAAWVPIVNNLKQLSQKYDKPVIFTEVGYRSIVGCNKAPWDWSIDGTFNMTEQANCYDAIFRAFKDQNWFYGFYFWCAMPDPNHGGTGNKEYTPNKKDAENILAKWWIESTTNHAPVLDGIGNKSVSENELLSFSINATDEDVGDILTYSAQNLPGGATFNAGTRTFTWTPTYDQGSNDYPVVFTVKDNQNAQDSETITITVNNINRAPVLNSIGNKTVNEGELLSFTVSATDVDGDTLTYTAENLPTGASFDPSARTFTWTPDYTQSGSYQPVFKVSDGQAEDSEIITMTVNNINRTPVFDPIADQTVNEGQTLEFIVHATDPDGDVLTYSVTNLPQGAAFDPNTQTFTWTPDYSQSGSYNVSFTASDGQSSSSFKTKATILKKERITFRTMSATTKDVKITVVDVDVTAPTITNKTPNPQRANRRIYFQAKIIDPSGVKSAYVRIYRNGKWRDYALRVDPNTGFAFYQYDRMNVATKISYKFIATDTVNNSVTTQTFYLSVR